MPCRVKQTQLKLVGCTFRLQSTENNLHIYLDASSHLAEKKLISLVLLSPVSASYISTWRKEIFSGLKCFLLSWFARKDYPRIEKYKNKNVVFLQLQLANFNLKLTFSRLHIFCYYNVLLSTLSKILNNQFIHQEFQSLLYRWIWDIHRQNIRISLE